MKKIFAAILLSAVFVPLAAYAAEVDSYVNRDYDFAHMKRICVWPVDFGDIPENVRLSLPNLIEDWINDALADRKKMRFTPLVKSTRQMWDNVQFIKGPFDFTDPFESAEATEKFYHLLYEACEGVLRTSVSVTQTRRWQEPRVEIYTTTETVRATERRRKPNGGWEEAVIYVDMPVTKERVIPGRWLVDTSAECMAELYDSWNLDGRYVAAGRSWEHTTKDEDESMQAVRDAARKTLLAALGAIFYK